MGITTSVVAHIHLRKAARLADSERSAVSHTIAKSLLRRLERIAYKHRVSRSAIVEYAVTLLFSTYPSDVALGEFLIARGAGRRRTT